MKKRLLVKSGVDVIDKYDDLPGHMVFALLINTIYQAAIGYMYISYPSTIVSEKTEATLALARNAGYGAIALSILSLTILNIHDEHKALKGGLITLGVYHVAMTSGQTVNFTQGQTPLLYVVIHAILGLYFTIMALRLLKLLK